VADSIDLTKLTKKFPDQAIKQRKGGGDKTFDYVSTDTVIRRLNEATNNQWTFEVISYQFLPGGEREDKYKHVNIPQQIMLVHGRLTIPGLGSRDGFGVQRLDDPITNTDDLLKAARGDALKTAAVCFGVAIDLYGKDLEHMTPEEIAAATPGVTRGMPATAPTRAARQAAPVAPQGGQNGQKANFPYAKAEGRWDIPGLVNWMKGEGFTEVVDFPTAIKAANEYGEEVHGVEGIVIGSGDWNEQYKEFKKYPSDVVAALAHYFKIEEARNAQPSPAPRAARTAPVAAAEEDDDDVPFD
jgi:hypothetical protein